MFDTKSRPALLGLLTTTALLTACGSGATVSSTNTTTETSSDTSPAQPINLTGVTLTNTSANCVDYVGEYTADALDVIRSLPFVANLTISLSSDKCLFSTDEIPNHYFNDGNFSFPNDVSEQTGSFQITTQPGFAAANTEISLGVTNAVLLNGVTIDLLPAACYNVADEKIGCHDMSTPWRFNPGSPLADFATDSHNAHAQPDGTYHYHSSPKALYNESPGEVSPVIGFAADGFPIYGPYFYKNGVVVAVESSFQLKSGDRPGGESSPAGAYDGTYRDDYEYAAGSGDLDECNGQTVNGQYGYYITSDYPYVLNCYKGTPDSSFSNTGQALVNRLHSHQ